MLQPSLAAPGWQAAALLGAPLLAGAALARWWRTQRPRRLSWDGAQWRLDPGAADAWGDLAVQRVEVRLDLQWALLLRASGPELGRGAGCGRRPDAMRPAGTCCAAPCMLARRHRPRPPIWGGRAGLSACSAGLRADRVGVILHSTPENEALLVQRAAAGDARAYELLVIKYQRRITRLIGRLVRDVDLVDDIAQETFIRAWRALPKFRGDAQFYTWLYRIAVNTAKKALLELKRDPIVTEAALRSVDDDDETSRRENELISESTPESELAAREIAAAVNAAMEALPEDLRQAITLREIEGLSYEEIAETMNCPIGTVRSRIFRAREAISAKVKPLLSHQSGKRW
jgi:RNA polymerase sigma-70 factor (ECF subfamily)